MAVTYSKKLENLSRRKEAQPVHIKKCSDYSYDALLDHAPAMLLTVCRRAGRLGIRGTHRASTREAVPTSHVPLASMFSLSLHLEFQKYQLQLHYLTPPQSAAARVPPERMPNPSGLWPAREVAASAYRLDTSLPAPAPHPHRDAPQRPATAAGRGGGSGLFLGLLSRLLGALRGSTQSVAEEPSLLWRHAATCPSARSLLDILGGQLFCGVVCTSLPACGARRSRGGVGGGAGGGSGPLPRHVPPFQRAPARPPPPKAP